MVTVDRPDAPDGTVLRVLPAAGSRVARGNTVTLYVAVTTVAVPDVVGRPVDAADERLASVGLMPGHEPADAGPGSVVSAQEPTAGQRLRHGGEVLLQLEAPPPRHHRPAPRRTVPPAGRRTARPTDRRTVPPTDPRTVPPTGPRAAGEAPDSMRGKPNVERIRQTRANA